MEDPNSGGKSELNIRITTHRTSPEKNNNNRDDTGLEYVLGSSRLMLVESIGKRKEKGRMLPLMGAGWGRAQGWVP